jgi:hypothetical protein
MCPSLRARQLCNLIPIGDGRTLAGAGKRANQQSERNPCCTRSDDAKIQAQEELQSDCNS